MNTNYILALIGAISLFFASCERVDDSISIDEKNTVLGEWQVVAYVDDEAVSDLFKINISLSNPTGKDSITISELGDESVFWDFSVNAAYVEQKNIFETKLSLCQVSEDEIVGVTISNGKLLASDSLYFEIKFEDDEKPFGTAYRIKGSRLEK